MIRILADGIQAQIDPMAISVMLYGDSSVQTESRNEEEDAYVKMSSATNSLVTSTAFMNPTARYSR